MPAKEQDAPESGLYQLRDNSWAPDTSKVAFDPVGPECYGRVAVLIKRPTPALDNSCFRFEDRKLPETLQPGTVLVRNTHLSMDPTHFIWSQEIPQYMPAVGLNTVMRCFSVGYIVKTTDEEKFPVGKPVSGIGGVAEYAVLPFAGVNACQPGVPVEMNLGPFSLIQGHTAWVGYKICGPKPGETMVVSGAAGAVGMLAGQLGKIAGARVIGIAGGKDKCAYVTKELGFDGCIDYKAESLADGLKRLCPKGVDSFFDNVGGATLDAVVEKMNCFGRIAMCGAISNYEGKMHTNAPGFKNVEMILMRRIIMQGFVVVDHLASVGEAMGEIAAGLKNGTIKWTGDVRNGSVNDYVKTVNLLLTGGNLGKLMLKIANPQAGPGTPVPAVSMGENNPGNQVDLAALCKDKKVVIFGVPGAFTPGCSKTHLPGYVANAEKIKAKGVDEILCVAPDNAFVMEQWGLSAQATGKVRMLSDVEGALASALGVDLQLGVLRQGIGMKRFSMIVEQGVITMLNVEPDGTGMSCSLADPLMKALDGK